MRKQVRERFAVGRKSSAAVRAYRFTSVVNIVTTVFTLQGVSTKVDR